MPAKRKNTRKKANPDQPRAIGRAGSTKPAAPSLNLVLKRLDKFDQRFDALDRKIEAVDQKVDALDQKTTAEFKAVRSEMAQGLAAVRSEMAQGFDSLRQEIKAEMQKEFEKHGAGIHQHITQVENGLRAEIADIRANQRYLTTGMENAAKHYEQFTDDRAIMGAEIHDLQRNVEDLKKRDMEKAAAIDKIEKEIDKLKAA
jgi:chromosome segregation ATPase